ncbi:alpha-ribazole phosphatase [uncultured Methylophaga sp.]|uniref:alpha-ribazole phosphatase n=1 Tax=uncultured Methylophaga sp. TaxID=285271 RepID=UPI002604D00E|nr:alpha-ribazole phosphatase [uncultured Methylophaga sp.]
MWPTVIDLLRHGEPEGGTRYRGQLDDPLSELGWQQMRDLLPVNTPWQQIITSPLKRCSAFAEDLARQSGLPLTYEPDLREIDFGDWEGQTAAALERADKSAFYAFYNDPLNNTPPGAEPLVDFQQRVLRAFDAIQQQYQQRHVLLVSHGGTIRIILAHVLNMPLDSIWRLSVPYASVSRIQIIGRGATAQPQLKFHAGRL